MENDYKEVLGKVFCDILEQLAFMFSEAAEKEDLPDKVDAQYLKASMAFKGPFQGTISLTMAKDMCAEMSANVLGVEPDDDVAIKGAQDALKELLNVTCGHVLTTIAGEEPIFDLTVPTVSDFEQPKWRSLINEPGTVIELVDDIPVMLNFEKN